MWPVETGASSGDTELLEPTGESSIAEENLQLQNVNAGQVVGSIGITIENKEENILIETMPEEETVAEEETFDYLQVLYAKKAINLRAKATTKSKVLAVTSKGDQLELLEKPNEKNWCKVRYKDEVGYLKYYHLSDSIEDVINDETKKESVTEESVAETVENEEVKDEEPNEDWEYLGNYYITGYRMFNAEENGGRSDGVTASGVVGTPGHTVAMKGIPFGTMIYVDGLGYYVVEDRGVGEGCVDIACNTKKETYELTGYRDVYIVN